MWPSAPTRRRRGKSSPMTARNGYVARMSYSVSDFVVDRLCAWGVERIYGYSGDGINGVVGALGRNEDRIRFIQPRHEEMGAFMACAEAKYTGRTGVCLATSGPGAIHLLNGLYDAKKDHTPVVALVGQKERFALGSDFQQEVDLVPLFRDVCRYVHMASVPAQVRTLIDQAFRIAQAERAVTAIVLPADLQNEAYEEAPRKHGMTLTGVGYRPPVIVPTNYDLEAAARILNEGKKVAMLVGAGALEAGEEVMQVAETLGAGVAKALLGRTVIDDELPYCVGSIGLLGTEPSWTLMKECDTLLMVGTSFPYSEFLPSEGQAKAVQIDLRADRLNLRYPCDVPLQGGARATLMALLPLLEKKADRAWQERIAGEVAHWWKVLEGRAYSSARPINPQRLFWELSPRLPGDAILASDSGSVANWFARDLKLRRTMKASLSGGLATMIPGVPYAIAAKMAFPERVAIGFIGDGAMQMLGNNGLITAGKYWKTWKDPRLVIAVLNNRDLTQVTWEQRVMEGEPKFGGSQELPLFDFARYAELCGLRGITVTEPEAIAPAWDEALAADRPVVLDVHTDPDVSPLPPHITFEQARNFLFSILKGDPSSPHQITQSIKGKLESWLPGSTS